MVDATLSTLIYRLDEIDQEILKLLGNSSLNVSSIAKKLGLNKGTVSRRLRKLKRWGLVKDDNAPRGSHKFYSLTDLGKSVASVAPRRLATVSVHNYRVSLEVAGIDVSRFGRVKKVSRVVDLDGVRQYVWRDGGFEFRLTGDKTITILFPRFDVSPGDFIPELVFYHTHYLVYAVLLLKEKYGISVDLRRLRVSRQEFHNALPELLKQVLEREKTFYLNKPAASIAGPTNIEADVKIDLTPTFGLETKDLDYETLFIITPLLVYRIFQTQMAFNQNIELHMDILNEMKTALKELVEYIHELRDLHRRPRKRRREKIVPIVPLTYFMKEGG